MTSDIPDSELETIVSQVLNIETFCGHDLGDVFIGKCLENGGFTSVIETQNENSSLVILVLLVVPNNI